jgi:hypothetical protein
VEEKTRMAGELLQVAALISGFEVAAGVRETRMVKWKGREM